METFGRVQITTDEGAKYWLLWFTEEQYDWIASKERAGEFTKEQYKQFKAKVDAANSASYPNSFFFGVRTKFVKDKE